MCKKKLRISFDIGGVLSKYPHIFRPLIYALAYSLNVELFVVTDMHDHEQSVKFVHDNGFECIPGNRILNSDYETYGELCKAVVLKENKIDIHIDDFPGYLTEGCPVRLLVWPNPEEPYYHDDWVTDGSEGNFGRRTKSKK
jgi:hypothetical protein